jgi:DNA-binding NarL/FixJ family response regulator
VLSGGVYVPTDCQGAIGGATRPRPAAQPQDLGLTHRQADVLKLLVQGKPNKLICRDHKNALTFQSRSTSTPDRRTKRRR